VSNRKQVPERDREDAAAMLVRIREELPSLGQSNSWAAIAAAINATRESEDDPALNGETFRKLAEFKQGGHQVVQAVQRFSRRRPRSRAQAPAEQTVELDERYPVIAEEFSYARAAGIKPEFLDAARILLGVYKGDGPTREQVREAVANAAREAKRAERFYRDALDLDE
jgi:hypothetical protein